ncbi:hypothetical protein RKD25_005200 [Streptomyces sp. SAI-124]
MQLRTVLATTTAALAAATCLTAGPAVASAPVSHACSPSVSLDRFSDALDKTTYDGTFVGNLSALAVDRDGSLAALSDRSALFGLDARTLAPRKAVPLADENGAALDSEGLVIDRDGTRLITSETEPSIRRYSTDGRILDRLPVPASLQVAPAGRATSNQTFEGLTLLHGGRTLLASLEYALSGDTAGTVRFQTWTRHGKTWEPAAQYAYRTDAAFLGVPEVQALPDGPPPRPGARLHLGRRQHGPPLSGRPPPRHGHQRRGDPHGPGGRTPDRKDPAHGHRELPDPGRDGPAAPAEPAPRQHRGHGGQGPGPGRPSEGPAGQRRQPERGADDPLLPPEGPGLNPGTVAEG